MGQVRDPSGEPLAGARIGCKPAALRQLATGGYLQATTDAEGRYRLRGLGAGWQLLSASHSQLPSAHRELDVVPGSNRLDWTLGGGHEVTGLVLDELGAPVADAAVRLLRIDPARLVHARSGAGGSFRFHTVPPGRYRLQAAKPGYATGELGEVVVVEDETVAALEVRLPAGTDLTGQILGVAPGQLAWIEVVAQRPGFHDSKSSTVDHRGRYFLRHLAAGEWTVTASRPGSGRLARSRISIEPAAKAVELDLDFTAGLELTGVVLDDGQPMRGARLTLLADGATDQTSTDYLGRFHLQGLAAATYRLEIRDDAHPPGHRWTIELTEDRDVVLDTGSAEAGR